MHQFVSKSSSSSPKGLMSCSATCSKNTDQVSHDAVRTQSEGWRGCLFHTLFSVVPSIRWSLEGPGLLYRCRYLPKNETRLRPGMTHLHGQVPSGSIYAVALQACAEKPRAFRSPLIDFQVQIKPLTTEGALTVCEALHQALWGVHSLCP